MFKRPFIVSLAVIFVGGAAIGLKNDNQSDAQENDFDTIIKNGTVMDGTGQSSYEADVGVRDGYIYQIGDLDEANAAQEVDADGQIVAPGFIDIHSHADLEALQTATSSLTQGVTTEILSPDGFGPVDVTERYDLEDDGLAINIGTYIGFNSVWSEVVGEDDRDATEEEITEMQGLVETGLEEGAFGVSAGLFYTPATYADTEEVIDVVEVADQWRTNFPHHIRDEMDDVVEATEETIEIGEEAGLVPVITHMKVMGADNWGASEETIGLIEEANERGTYAAADVYPYLASQTGLTALVPAWVEDGGFDAMLERFADPELRPQIEEEIEDVMTSRVETAEDVYFPGDNETLADVAEREDVSPGEATMRILEDRGSLTTIYHFGHEDDYERILQNPTTAVASDGGATYSDSIHPRRYGSQPRVLGEDVRENGLLSFEEAVQKMTGLPATMIGMTDRGFIAEGMVADITVFDPETVTDNAEFEDPQQYADGIEQVLVNGEFALQDGGTTDAQLGEALQRTGNMPSRPMSVDKDVSVEGAGTLRNVDGSGSPDEEVAIAVEQAASDSAATGYFQFNHEDAGIELEADEVGQLQAKEDWASFTGLGTLENGEERTFEVIVEENDPMIEDERASVTVYIEDELEYQGTLSPEQMDVQIAEPDIAPPENAADIEAVVEDLAEDGEFANDEATRALTVHLTAVHHYENQDAAEQVIQHMGGFQDLLDHQLDEALISEEAYDILSAQAEDLLDIWE
ncbi:N-acyl-D-amino-acid deacylase family protein [Natribacillus halophilus]|uniref:N-acyl-D-aspartate/D-glutamate deacylase n=1 Tax=Natribacillus halophilus TaxID=549003 RepID=A0A1G8MUS9_9BACI|nr:amidohydrolase family protein [Natribacillus halophilus]SDI71597.1 N-acyl-D-aspartate/D-glutamate deacylase [Natribacillus halophilus]